MPFELSKSRFKLLSKNLKSIIENIIHLIKSYFIKKKIISIYKTKKLIGHSSNDFKKILNEKYNIKLKYYSHPTVQNNLSFKKLIKKRKIMKQKKFNILILGSMSTVNYSQYSYFQNEILSLIKQNIDTNKIQINLVGADKNPIFEKLYNEKFIKFKGRVKNIKNEFLLNDIILSPTNILAGLRSRLNEALGYGCLVICSDKDANSDLHLQHNFNCLVGNNAKQFVNNIKKVIKDQRFYNSIQKKAFYTYKNELNNDRTIGEYLKDIEKII